MRWGFLFYAPQLLLLPPCIRARMPGTHCWAALASTGCTPPSAATRTNTSTAWCRSPRGRWACRTSGCCAGSAGKPFHPWPAATLATSFPTPRPAPSPSASTPSPTPKFARSIQAPLLLRLTGRRPGRTADRTEHPRPGSQPRYGGCRRRGETERHLAILKSLDCNSGQDYFFTQPAPAFAALLRNRSPAAGNTATDPGAIAARNK